MKYKTLDYLRDNYLWFDSLVSLLIKGFKGLDSFVKKIVNLDVDNYIFRIAENLPYGLLILFLGFFLVVGLIRITERGNGLKVYNITTSSMDPAVKPGSLVFSYPKSRYRVGDIINYKEKNQRTKTYTGRVLTHRIVEISEKNRHFVYTAKGDNNEHPDPGEITTSDISGSVFLIMPVVGYVDYLVRTIPGFLIFIAVPAFVLIKEARYYLRQKN